MTDLRSDTVTRPNAAMLEAMMNAPTGDDVFGEDPTVNRLEAMAAAMFGMEAAVFCPSGTMTNQVAIRCHTQPGDEVICETLSHVYIYEGGGIASNSGSQVKPVDGNRGRITAEQVKACINPLFDYKARTSLVCVENTTNRGGGACYDFADLQDIKNVCLENNLSFHLDGARLWNALVVKPETRLQYGALFDSISICLSKGLGAPAGSLLLGSRPFISKARRVRKVFGGGMRQSGFLAGAGIYALENNIDRLAKDHDAARKVADVLVKKDFVTDLLLPETNILIFEVGGRFTAAGLVSFLASHDVLVISISPVQVRMVFHLDVTEEMISRLLELLAGM